MDKILVISPHVDDELYGCIGYILNNENNIDIYYCTHSASQNKRFKVITEIFSDSKIKFKRLKNSWYDASDDKPLTIELTSELDKLFCSGKYSTVLFNSSSLHQDHEFINKAVKRALRPRPELKINRALEYGYHYNALNSKYDGSLILYIDRHTYNKINKIWEVFEDKCKVGKDPKYMSYYTNWNKYGEFLGSFKGYPYAEVYKPYFYQL